MNENGIVKKKMERGTLKECVEPIIRTEYLTDEVRVVVALVHTNSALLRGVAVCGKNDYFDLEKGKTIAFINAIEA